MSKDKDKDKIKLPKIYERPTISSEDLMAFAAVCNGSTSGGRKSSIGSPSFCNSKKLNS